MIHRDVDRSPSVRKTKIQYGDIIQRSEYTDGVLRNNNRAGNRLSNEMKMYDRAQKVMLKQMGKETQLLRNKIATTTTSTSASPRLTKLSTTEVKLNPFVVYGTKSQKFEPKNINFHPLPPSLADKYEPSYVPTPRGDGTNDVRRPANTTKTNKKSSRRSGLKSENKTDNSKTKISSILNDGIGEEDSGIQTGSSLSEYRVSRLRSDSALSDYKFDRGNVSSVIGESRSRMKSESAMSERRDDRCLSNLSVSSVMAENRSRLNHTQSARSGVSFIDILKEAEERRAKQESQMKELNERMMQESKLENPKETEEPQTEKPIEESGDKDK